MNVILVTEQMEFPGFTTMLTVGLVVGIIVTVTTLDESMALLVAQVVHSLKSVDAEIVPVVKLAGLVPLVLVQVFVPAGEDCQTKVP